MSDVIRAVVEAQMRREQEYIEHKLLLVLGWRRHLPNSVIIRLGYEVVWQQHPDDDGHWLTQQFRGIRRNGRMLYDEHPDWGEVRP